MIRIAICDDNNAICSQIEGMILEYKKNNLIEIEVEVFWTGENLIKFIENEGCFDLIFLDIELGTTTGIEISQKIRNEFDDYVSKIIFVTAKDGYEQQLFDVQPLNFIRKPIEKEKLINCINLAIKLLNINCDMFEYTVNRNKEKITFNNIIFFESKLKKIKMTTVNGVEYFYGTFNNIKEQLPKTFVATHGSFIVNFSHIKRITTDRVYMTDDSEVPISQRYLKNIRTLQIDYETEKRNVRL